MKWIRPFIYSAGGILLAAALIRFIIAAGDSPALLLPEPMLGIPLRYAVLIAGGIELAAALICLFGRQIGFQAAWLAWLATNFVVFRIGLLLMHGHPQATCIGSLTDPLHLSRGTTGFIVGFMPFYLLLGSYAAAIWLWLTKEGRAAQLAVAKRGGDRRSRTVPAGFLKVSCPYCGGHIEFPAHGLGQTVACPHCTAMITLQKPDVP